MGFSTETPVLHLIVTPRSASLMLTVKANINFQTLPTVSSAFFSIDCVSRRTLECLSVHYCFYPGV